MSATFGTSSTAGLGVRAAGLPQALRRRQNWVQFAKFGMVGTSGYVANLGVYALLLNVASLHYVAAPTGSFLVAAGWWNRTSSKIVAQGIAVILVTPLNFLGNKLWSFRR